MNWDLPLSVYIEDKEYRITKRCDYRIVLDCIDALTDPDLDRQNCVVCALIIFYEDLKSIDDVYSLVPSDFEALVKEMYKIIDYGEEIEQTSSKSRKKMDWHHDFPVLAPTIGEILGYDIRLPDKYTHWWTVIGAFYQVGDCAWATIMSVREKLATGKKLEKWEREFLNENRKKVILPLTLTTEEQALLEAEW